MDIINFGCVTESGSITTAQAALDAVINGYNDWYLPSRDELLEMYNTIGNVNPQCNLGAFVEDVWPCYCSSSEQGGDTNLLSWGVRFDNGGSYFFNKYDNFRVCVIRSF